MTFDEQLRNTLNAKLADALEYIGSRMKGGISDGILKEAAKRLRDARETQYVEPPPRDKPPLKAYAVPD